MGITYHPVYRPGKNQHTKGKLKDVAVHLDGRLAGYIRHPAASNGWAYFPKGQKIGGEVFPTVEACKRSIEGVE